MTISISPHWPVRTILCDFLKQNKAGSRESCKKEYSVYNCVFLLLPKTCFNILLVSFEFFQYRTKLEIDYYTTSQLKTLWNGLTKSCGPVYSASLKCMSRHLVYRLLYCSSVLVISPRYYLNISSLQHNTPHTLEEPKLQISDDASLLKIHHFMLTLTQSG